MRRILATLTFTLALSLVPQLAFAATYSDSVDGFEIFATSTRGVFVGGAGALPGSWNATVDHTVLGTTATITGGSFSLATVVNRSPATVNGLFNSGGTITQKTGFTGCVDQTYEIKGSLSHVGVGTTGTGTGSFTATLTHQNRNFLFFGCFTVRATVAGDVTLDF